MIDEKKLRDLLELSKLHVPEDELAALSRELDTIVSYFERLSSYDTRNVDVDLSVAKTVESLRADSAAPGLDEKAIRSFSKSFQEDGYFHVQRILGDDHG